MIIMLHGFGSSGTGSSTCKMVKEHFEGEHTVFTPSYDVTRPFAVAKELERIATEECLDEELHIVGISFGGFLARWLANHVKPEVRPVSSLTLLNPALDGYKTMMNRMGVNESYSGGPDIVIGEHHATIYSGMNVDADRPGLAIGVLVGGEDDVIPCDPTIDEFASRARTSVLYKADHRFTGFKTEVLRFIENTVNNLHG